MALTTKQPQWPGRGLHSRLIIIIMQSPLILNLPYSSCSVPPAVARSLGLSEEELRAEHWRLCDPNLARLVRAAAQREGKPERAVLAYPFSPLVADPLGLWAEELGAASREPSVLPRFSCGRVPAWSDRDKEILLSRTIEPYFQRLEEAVSESLKTSPLVLVLTLRSFSSRPLDFEKSRTSPRPQVVVGAAEGLTPPGLAALAFNTFRGFHWWVERTWPQRGPAWLPPSLRTHPRVKALGLSLKRSLYLDERSGRAGASLEGARRVLGVLFNLLEQEAERVGRIKLERASRDKIPSPVIKAGSI